MRKTLLFAFALVASVLAFTSCNKKDANTPDEPIVENPLVGTWFTSDVENDYFYTFNSDGSYQRVMDYYMNGRAVVAHEHIVADGTYQSDKDILTANIDSIRIYMDGSKDSGPFDDFWPAQEKMKFKVEGDKLTLTHDYESGDAWTEVLTKNGKPADQDDPSDIDIDPAKLVKTEWRTDSCFLNGERTAPPHLYIEILSEDALLMNGENHNFVINGDKMTCTFFDGMTFTFVEVKEGWAHIKGDNGSDIYLSKLPERDYDAMIMEHQASDFYGTWKLAYFTYEDHNPDHESWNRVGTNPGVETWEFKADGSCVYNSWFSGETVTGTWECDPYMIKFTRNPAEGAVIQEGEAITVQPLTHNWMAILRSPDGFQYYYWWFVRVK